MHLFIDFLTIGKLHRLPSRYNYKGLLSKDSFCMLDSGLRIYLLLGQHVGGFPIRC